MPVRGIRGATTVPVNTRDAIVESTRELLQSLVHANGVKIDDIASIFFTITPDLDAAFPASAARALGWDHVPLLDAQEPAVLTDIPRCVRVLVHWNTDCAARQVRHIYLHEATRLRPDLTQGG